ncbi:uncharacterized protein LOC125324980 isoform X4 [Corvus hawaiiensis]|uniref:uncharacterized protein LOC125324980 isoform X4 n=1 Tax=Corvus hawaiiensis TaxID=134902 RepID=UPI002019CCA7|nr:uncharacterized protein LOC125324980 isoform X4 [Corvus hawaiiensis]
MAQPISVVAGEEAAGPRGTGSVTPAQPISVVAGEEAAASPSGMLDSKLLSSPASLSLDSCAHSHTSVPLSKCILVKGFPVLNPRDPQHLWKEKQWQILRVLCRQSLVTFLAVALQGPDKTDSWTDSLTESDLKRVRIYP